MLNVKIKRLQSGAMMPTKANDHDAGWDFYAPLDMRTKTLFPHERMTIKIGLAMAIPNGWYLQVMSRSGLASKSIDARAGVIDCTYRGEIGIVLHNDSAYDVYEIKPGHKIAQGIFLPVPSVIWDETDDLGDTERGAGGFGSTGV